MAHIKTRAWTDQQRQEMLEQFYDSGLAQKDFCAAKNLQQSTLLPYGSQVPDECRMKT